MRSMKPAAPASLASYADCLVLMIRPAVVIRKVCGGNRTRRGADTQQVLSSVVRTARQRGLDVPGLFAEMLRAPAPVVPEVLGLPPPPA